MRLARFAAAAVIIGFAATPGAGEAAPGVACNPFTSEALATPAPRVEPAAVTRFDLIKDWVKTRPYHALFLGDSLVERWDPANWDETMAPLGVLNAGVSGDRTEHLIWRLDHGNLAGPPPHVAIVLIGTNDLGHGRSPALAAEGIRAVLLKLRDRLSDTRILLLGLWPRNADLKDHLRQEVDATNRLISTCADNQHVFYADIGGVVLDIRGHLSRDLSPDLLHFSAAGYDRLAPPLDRLLEPLLRAP